MRELGLPVTSPKAIQVAKRDLARLGISAAHFIGQRTWSDGRLRRAFADGHSWADVLVALGLDPKSGDGRTRVKAHAVRLGLDLAKFQTPDFGADAGLSGEPDLKNLRDAGTSLAAAWFLVRGYNAAFPIEPTVYDLVVSGDLAIQRVQVKTTTCHTKDGWVVRVGRRPYSVGNRDPLVPYDPDLIDLFFIVDGGLTMYVIPSRVIGGRISVLLRTYSHYIVGNAAGLMEAAPTAG